MGKYDAAPTLAAGLIRIVRNKAVLTQQELADRAGLTQQSISAYETGRKDPSLASLQNVIRAAGFELKIQLVPLDQNDESVAIFVESLPPEVRASLDRAQQTRVELARLSRVRGH